MPNGWSRILSRLLFAQFLFVIPINVFSMDTQTAIPNFDTLPGDGLLEQTGPEGSSSVTASLTVISDLTIAGNDGCRGLWLKSGENSIVVIASCPSGQVFICPGGLGSCEKKDEIDPTEVSKNVWKMYVPAGEVTYRVEFYPERFVYRIQKRRCFIPYPHGCLIYGFGWRDEKSYEFRKN